MGYLLRRIDNHFTVEYRGSEPPPNPDPEIYEIVEADGLVKPAEQIAAEEAAAKQAILTLLQAMPAAQTIEGYSERSRILFAMEVANATRALIAKMDAVMMSDWKDPGELRAAWRTAIAAAPPQLTEEQVAASLAAKQAQAIGVE